MGIVYLLSKEFIVLVFLAFVVAAPVAYVVMQRWLENFVYQIDLSLGFFAWAGLLTRAVALLTLGFQAIKAALSDPVDALRYE